MLQNTNKSNLGKEGVLLAYSSGKFGPSWKGRQGGRKRRWLVTLYAVRKQGIMCGYIMGVRTPSLGNGATQS